MSTVDDLLVRNNAEQRKFNEIIGRSRRQMRSHGCAHMLGIRFGRICQRTTRPSRHKPDNTE